MKKYIRWYFILFGTWDILSIILGGTLAVIGGVLTDLSQSFILDIFLTIFTFSVGIIISLITLFIGWKFPTLFDKHIKSIMVIPVIYLVLGLYTAFTEGLSTLGLIEIAIHAFVIYTLMQEKKESAMHPPLV